MIACDSCERPLLQQTDVCPFCERPAPVGRWLKAAGAILAPFVLSACYGQPGVIFIDECAEWDDDGDGFVTGNCFIDDCDDSDPDVFPSAEEVCDGVDNDCDGQIDEDECVDEDTDTTASTGDIEVQYDFLSLEPGCEAAGVQVLVLSLDGPESVPDARLACDDTRLSAPFLQPGTWSVDVAAVSADGTRQWVGETVDAVVVPGGTTVATVTLTCEPLEPDACVQ